MHTFTPKLSLNLERTFGPNLACGSLGLHSTEGFFHVVLSGNRRKVLFSTVDDRRALNAIAIDVLQRFDATLHAYCLMPNHFRALVQINDRLLIKALRRIATRYSQHRQRQAKAAPHLFERPYTAQRLDTDGDFLDLLRHIHLTPVVANKVIAPDDYLWSSHRAYLGYKSVAKITTEFGLSLFAAEPAQARVAYHQFIAKGLAEDVARAKDRRVPVSGSRAPASEAPAATTAPPEPKSPALIDSPVPPSTSTLTPPGFGRNRRRAKSRFMSIY